jgi:HPt (histidine-containing phosphotransfer) domain-containing protein
MGDGQKTLRAEFAKHNENAFSEITAAIDGGDMKTAHRVAHTLKSNAKLIGEDELSRLALEVEGLLKDGTAPSGELLASLGKELADVLSGIAPPEKGPFIEPKELDKEKAEVLFAKLEKMLDSRSAECLALVASLREVPATEELVAQIENFDFTKALETLRNLIKSLGLA